MLNAGVEGPGRRVPREAKGIAAPDLGQPAGPSGQQEAQRPHAAQVIGVGTLAGSAPGSGNGVELKAPTDIVGEDAELRG
jgi:hypothetical protein